jgi:hypothetical protein
MEVDFRFGQFPACSRKVAWIKDLAQKTGDSKGDSGGFWISDPYLFGSGGAANRWNLEISEEACQAGPALGHRGLNRRSRRQIFEQEVTEASERKWV